MTDAWPMPIAGPVFVEWYWTPIFLAVVYGPPILAVAGVLYLLARRTGWRRGTRAAAALASARPVLVARRRAPSTGTVTLRARGGGRRPRGDASPSSRRAACTRLRAEVYDGLRPSVHWTFERGGRELFASQLAARGDDIEAAGVPRARRDPVLRLPGTVPHARPRRAGRS